LKAGFGRENVDQCHPLFRVQPIHKLAKIKMRILGIENAEIVGNRTGFST
jgi:hypothetical protein